MMLFSKKRANISMNTFNNILSSNNNNNNNITTNNLVMGSRILQAPPPTQSSSATTIVPFSKPMKWGEPTWFLFHTLAEKIKSEYFDGIRDGLLDLIYSISSNLPCPDCANHAKMYLDNINFKRIRTKEDLKQVLFVFHNSVNIRKGLPLFPIENLDKKYSTAITMNIIQNFMFYFEDRHSSPRMISDDLYRKRIASNLKSWFQQNIQYFD